MVTWWVLAGLLGALVLLWVGLVSFLVLVGRRQEARALAGFVADCIVLVGRLSRDPRVPRLRKWLLVGLAAYLALPFDLVPDFVPVAGQVDDALLVVIVLRRLVRGSGEQLVREHWPGPETSLRIVLRAAGSTQLPSGT